MTDAIRYDEILDWESLRDHVCGENGEFMCRNCETIYCEDADGRSNDARCRGCKVPLCDECGDVCVLCEEGLLNERLIFRLAAAAAAKEGLTLAALAVKLGVIEREPVPVPISPKEKKKRERGEDEQQEPGDGEGTDGASPLADRFEAIPAADVEGPITGGTYDVPYLGMPEAWFDQYGYTEEEYFLSGDATAYGAKNPTSTIMPAGIAGRVMFMAGGLSA